MSTSPLPYPEKFKAAVKFVKDQEEKGAAFNDENRLALYALEQQAVHGPCKESKPWGWNVIESAKWQGWSQLGDMASVEAMRLYVRLVEDEVPTWWEQHEGKQTGSSQSGQSELPVSSNPIHSNDDTIFKQHAKAGEQTSLSSADTPASQAGDGATSLHDVVTKLQTCGPWTDCTSSGSKRPPPRYEHAASIVGRHLYVIGGNCGGRYLNDIWVLSLDQLTWQQLTTTAKPQLPIGGGQFADPEPDQRTPLLQDTPDSQPANSAALPPSAGHVLITWGSSFLCIGGHTKAGTYSQLRKAKDAKLYMIVRVLDTHKKEWSYLHPAGNDPPQRGGQTGTLIGSKVYLFGGEDAARRPQGDLFVLDLADKEWQTPQTTGTPPPARSAHAAAAYKSRYLLIFGGGSVANCYNDLHMLDTETMQWSQPTVNGSIPTPRAGHAGAVLGDTWYIAGGGNNTSGCTDMLALDVSPLAGDSPLDEPLTWSTVGHADARGAIVSEGMTVQAVPSAKCLLAFGGYNGKYQSALQVFKAAVQQHHKLPPQQATESESPRQSQQAAASPHARGAQGRPVALETPKDQYNRHLEAARSRSGTLSGNLGHRVHSPKAAILANGDLPEEVGTTNGHDSVAGSNDSRQASEVDQVSAGKLQALQKQLDSALQRASTAEKAVESAKEAAATELALMRRQLASAQAALAEAEQRAGDAESQLLEEQSKVMKLEVTVAEQQQQLGRMEDLEKELTHHRKLNKEADGSKAKGTGGIWGYIAGTPTT